MAVFVVLGIHLPGLVDALRDRPVGAEYLALPMAFWVVKFYDLGIVAPAALAVGVGLLRRQPWARKPAYGILGGYVLLGWSVAGMGWSMLLGADPDASCRCGVGRDRTGRRRHGLRLLPLPTAVRAASRRTSGGVLVASGPRETPQDG